MLKETILALAACAATLSLPLAGAEAAPVSSIRVETSNLALDTDAGRSRLDSRIHAAVRAVCGPASSAVPGSERVVDECRRSTQAAARQDAARLLAARRPVERLAAQ